MISLIEMNLLRIIREYYPEQKWIDLIKHDRFEKVKEKYDTLSKDNVEIEFGDCLDFCDKREIIIKNKELLNALCISKNSCEQFLTRLEKLRNQIAHAGDIITKELSYTIELVRNAEEYLYKCEKFENK